MDRQRKYLLLPSAAALCLCGCLGDPAGGVAPAAPARTTVKMDLFHKPLPEIPLPNDLATRHDPTSATGLRINASMLAPTRFEARIRELIDELDGWGIYQPISIPFSGPLDVGSIVAGHRDADYDLSNDVVYLINIDPDSPEFGKAQYLDVGNGNFPMVLEELDLYGKNDPRGWTQSLLFEEADEDANGDGVLDPAEDTDADGVLDRPNYLPGKRPARDDLAGRADALMTFYEQESNTLLLRPLLPLRERTTYAVVVTRRLKDSGGHPVGSPYPYINHTSQTAALSRLPDLLPQGLALEEVAFAFSFTTQSVLSPMIAVREGLYGHGVQAHIGQSFPAEVVALERLRDDTAAKNPYLLQPERYLEVYRDLAAQLFDLDSETAFMDAMVQAHRYVDFHVFGTFEAPQLFQRRDSAGELLPLHDQVWPPDLDKLPAETRAERVTFWLTVPRKEVSDRGEGKPAPVVILVPGYESSWVEMLFIGIQMVKHGVAVACINAPAHGLEFDEIQEAIARQMAKGKGFESLFNAMMQHRAFDQNNDNKADSGADVLSAYMFHTRDMLRQGTLDLMQLVRLFRGFDGAQRWSVDVNGDGKPELAGDFDADGVVDVGGTATISIAGGSLGGIMTMMVGSLEPGIETIVPYSGGAGLGDVGIRSRHTGVPQAFFLRLMSPIYTGTLDDESGLTTLETIVPDLNQEALLNLATVKGVARGDTMVVENLESGERGCGLVNADGTVRAQLESNQGDPIRVLFYPGAVVVGEDCELKEGAKPKVTVDAFEEQVVFQNRITKAGEPLKAMAEGLGLRRASPGLRRLIAFGSMVVDPGDPIAFVRHLLTEPITYPYSKETTGAHALIATTVGDMDVPPSTGIAAARAAGLIDFLRPDPRYGKPINQVLIDTYTVEGVHTFGRHVDSAGNPVHLDVDNLSQGNDMWGAAVPRMAQPLRIGVDKKDRWGGVSAALFPYSDPTGMHMVSLPGVMTDDVRDLCKAKCKAGGDDPCGCNSLKPFDLGFFFYNMLGRYLRSGGTSISFDLCNGHDSCSELPPPPDPRDLTTLP